MSRIHEALKKAEEQRSVSLTGHSEPVAAGELPAPNPVPPPVEMGPGTSTMPGFSSSSFNFDTLLARCPQMNWSPDLKTMLFFQGDENVPGTEEFRTLRSRLYQMREKITLKKVLVTSALPKEGKSFVAANLAQVMVKQHGRRALLIDADLRGARLHNALGTTAKPGLAEYLLGESDEFGVMQRGALDNLFFIPSGRMVSNPAELVANGRLKFLLNRIEPLFDWIIIDSPPAVPVSDAALLANYCDGVLMVVRSSATPHDAARKAREEFHNKVIVGVVLNGASEGDSTYSRYYYTTAR
ncbi:MAG: CpsD/CapB family tyrosine-protein kinase [Acidobacteria bacterium]|jgi:capsular exopolysaccharide synthesis family protein|nr:CpsD/CapB family tyrosine-protein kinase [Acidobacteriota bacterium]